MSCISITVNLLRTYPRKVFQTSRTNIWSFELLPDTPTAAGKRQKTGGKCVFKKNVGRRKGANSPVFPPDVFTAAQTTTQTRKENK